MPPPSSATRKRGRPRTPRRRCRRRHRRRRRPRWTSSRRRRPAERPGRAERELGAEKAASDRAIADARAAAEKAKAEAEKQIAEAKAATDKAKADAEKATKLAAAAPAPGGEALFEQASALEQQGKGNDAVKLYVRAARSGNGKAAKRLGDIYDKGLAGVSRDYAESLKWYNAARVLGEEVPLQKSR